MMDIRPIKTEADSDWALRETGQYFDNELAPGGVEAAQSIQLHMVYAPEPPFNSGTPETAPAAILDQARKAVADITARREERDGFLLGLTH